MRTHLSQLWLCAAILAAPLTPAQAADNTADVAARPLQTLARQPLHFEPLSAPHDGDFVSRGRGVRLQLSATGATLMLPPASGADPDAAAPGTLSWQLVGARADARGEGEAALPGRSHYFMGSDPAQWRRNVPNYARVRYHEVYPGIDLVYHGDQQQLEYDFVVAPGADPAAVRLRFDRSTRLSLNEGGDLVVRSGERDVVHRRPVAYQDAADRRTPVEAAYRLGNNSEVSFALGDYDPGRTLVIDPIISHAGFLGGTETDYAQDIAVDSNGNIYLYGVTFSADFPISNALQGDLIDGVMGFVTKLDPTATSILFSTYLGPTGTEGGYNPEAMAVTPQGDLYLVGSTSSPEFPVVNPLGACGDATGTSSAVITKLSADGSEMLYSTCLGGDDTDSAQDVDADPDGRAFVTGYTYSRNFPVVAPIQSKRGGAADAFVTIINATGTALDFSTYLGGDENDQGAGIAVGLNGRAHVVGSTQSPDFPMANAFQGQFGDGTQYAYVAILATANPALEYSTFLGGSGSQGASSVDVDAEGYMYVSGSTNSLDFPLVNALQGKAGTDLDVFAAKFAPGLATPLYLTCLGGSASDYIAGIAATPGGEAYIIGTTDSLDFPLVEPIQSNYSGYFDLYISQLSSDGQQLQFSSYIGGWGSETQGALSLDAAGQLHLTAGSSSRDFPHTGVLEDTLAGPDTDGSYHPDAVYLRIVPGTVDALPDPFHFADVVDAVPGETVKSGSKQVNGFSPPMYVSALGGEVAVNVSTYGEWFSQVHASPGDTLKLKATAADTPATTVTTRINAGSFTDHWTVMTAAVTPPGPTTPEPFHFVPVDQAAEDTWTSSAVVKPSGYTDTTDIAAIGGQYRIKLGGTWGEWTSTAGTLPVASDLKVQLRVKSSTKPDRTTSATLTIGGVSAVFSVTTAP